MPNCSCGIRCRLVRCNMTPKRITKLLALLTTFGLILNPGLTLAQEINAGNNGNGEGSTNTSGVNINQSTRLEQTNTSDIQNTVSLNINTGSNQANQNTGSQASTKTGSANATVDINNQANTNQAAIVCDPDDVTAQNTGNGAGSTNQATIVTQQTATVIQENTAQIENDIQQNLNTGRNQSSQNVGDVKIDTGQVKSSTSLNNSGNDNLTKLVLPVIGEIKALNQGNGVESYNETQINLEQTINLQQQSSTQLKNNVAVEANTGDNHCNQNVGDCQILTGEIEVVVDVNNDFNRNRGEVGKKPTPTPTKPPVTAIPTPIPSEITPIPTQPLQPTPTGVMPTLTVTPIPEGGFVEPTPTPTTGPGPTPILSPTPSIPPTPPGFIEELLEKIVPKVLAAITPQELVEEEREEGKLLGVTALPVTGFGPSLSEILAGLLVIAGSLKIKQGLKGLEEKQKG